MIRDIVFLHTICGFKNLGIFLSSYSVYADKQLSAYTLHANKTLSVYTLYEDKANLFEMENKNNDAIQFKILKNIGP